MNHKLVIDPEGKLRVREGQQKPEAVARLVIVLGHEAELFAKDLYELITGDTEYYMVPSALTDFFNAALEGEWDEDDYWIAQVEGTQVIFSLNVLPDAEQLQVMEEHILHIHQHTPVYYDTMPMMMLGWRLESQDGQTIHRQESLP